jgi:hypothetical protein
VRAEPARRARPPRLASDSGGGSRPPPTPCVHVVSALHAAVSRARVIRARRRTLGRGAGGSGVAPGRFPHPPPPLPPAPVRVRAVIADHVLSTVRHLARHGVDPLHRVQLHGPLPRPRVRGRAHLHLALGDLLTTPYAMSAREIWRTPPTIAPPSRAATPRAGGTLPRSPRASSAAAPRTPHRASPPRRSLPSVRGTVWLREPGTPPRVRRGGTVGEAITRRFVLAE